MNKEEILRKVESNEGLTEEEIKFYESIEEPVEHTYGKYGNLALKYIMEENTALQLVLAGRIPEYLHNVDKQADALYEVMYEKLSKKPEYRKTGNYMHDLKIEEEKKHIIEEEILNTIVYVKEQNYENI